MTTASSILENKTRLRVLYSTKRVTGIRRKYGQGVYKPLPHDHIEPHSSVGSVADLRTGGRWLDPRSANILS